MLFSATEKDVLTAVAKLGKASKSEISRRVGYTIDYVELICNYLIRKGCLTRFERYYRLTEEGERVIYFVEGNSPLTGKESIKDFTSVAEQIVKKVLAGMKATEIKTTKTDSKEKRVYAEKRQPIQIKTDFEVPIEDESLVLESNIDQVGIKSEREKTSINKSIKLLQNIQKKTGR